MTAQVMQNQLLLHETELSKWNCSWHLWYWSSSNINTKWNSLGRLSICWL